MQSCVWFLLTRVQGGYLWLDQLYLIDQAIIHRVSGLPTSSENPTNSLKEKDAPLEEVYSKYDTQRGKHGDILIPAINDSMVRFATQLLACKLIRKCRKEECPIRVILMAEHLLRGIRWLGPLTYLKNLSLTS
jgi:hypothetical protein